MPATAYYRKKLIDGLTQVTPYTPPEPFLSLHTASPGDSGSHLTELAVGGYARVSLVGKMSAADPVTGISVNTVLISFGPFTVDVLVAYLGFEDAATGGNMLMPGVPSLPKIVAAGAPFQITPGNLRLRAF